MKRFWLMFAALTALLCLSSAQADMTLPKDLKVIEAQAFYGDRSLDSVTLPEGVQRIESQAFAESSLRSVVLPASLTFIADDAFSQCENLTVTAEAGTYAYAWAVKKDLIQAPAITQVFAPDTLKAGADLQVELLGPKNAIRHNAFLIDSNGKQRTAIVSERNGSVLWKGYSLEKGNYRLVVYTFTDSYETLVPITKQITVTGEKQPAPQVDIPETAYLHHNIYFEISNPIYLKQIWYDKDGNVIYSFDQERNEATAYIWNEYNDCSTIQYSISAYVNEKWTDFYTGTISVTPEYILTPPVVDAPDTSIAGQDYTFSYSSVEHADAYEINLYRQKNNNNETENIEEMFADGTFWDTWEEEKYWYYRNATTITIPGHNLSEGVYLLRVASRVESSDYSATSYQKITISGNRPSEPVASSDKSEFVMGSSNYPIIAIQGKNAQRAVISYQCYKKNNTSDYSPYQYYISMDEDGHGTYRMNSIPNNEQLDGGYVEYKVSVLEDDIWSEWSEPGRISLKKPQPLEKPVITARDTIEAGEDFSFSFAPVENANGYYVSIRAVYGDSDVEWQNISNGDTVIISKGYKYLNGKYCLTVSAYGDGYASSSTEFVFTVTGNKPAAPSVTADKEAVHVNENVQFTIQGDYEEAVVRYKNIQDGDWGYNIETVSKDSRDLLTWKWQPNERNIGKIYSFEFSAKQDGKWSAWKTLTYEILDLPQLDAPVIHAEKTYPAGADIVLTYDAVEQAEEYTYRFYKNDIYWGSTIKKPEEYIEYGYYLEPGNYRFTVTAKAPNYKSSTSEVTFTVEGKKPAAPVVDVDKTIAKRGEKCTFRIPTQDAEELFYRRNSNNWGPINILNDTTVWETTVNNTITYSFSVKKNGLWSAWSDPIVIYCQEVPPVAPSVITVPEKVYQGMDLKVAFSEVENATQYRVNVFRNEYQGSYYNYAFEKPEEVVVPGYYLRLGTVKIEVSVSTQDGGYASSSASTRVVASEQADGPLVTPPEKDTVVGGEDFTFTVASQDAEQIAARYYRVGNPNNVNYRDLSVSGDETSWMTYLYDEKGTYAYSFCVKKNGVWSVWSDEIYITLE